MIGYGCRIWEDEREQRENEYKSAFIPVNKTGV